MDAQKTNLLLAFGDSYTDVGNRAKRGPNIGKGWEYLYGITWPETGPVGRYSDCKTQTDWFGELFQKHSNLQSNILNLRLHAILPSSMNLMTMANTEW